MESTNIDPSTQTVESILEALKKNTLVCNSDFIFPDDLSKFKLVSPPLKHDHFSSDGAEQKGKLSANMEDYRQEKNSVSVSFT